MDGYLRIGFGSDPEYLESALTLDWRVPALRRRCMRADLALVGFGHVGRRFARLLEERRDWLSLDYDLDCRIVGIATRHHGARLPGIGRRRRRERGQRRRRSSARRARRAARGDSLDVIRRLAASDAPLKVLVETTTLDIKAGQPAIDYVRAALQAGCHVVTANKGPAAFAYEELSALAGRSPTSRFCSKAR